MVQSILVAVFPTRTALRSALDYLIEEQVLEIKRAAIVAKAQSGETLVLDDDLSPREGGVAGGTLGAAMTALGMVQLGALALPGVGMVLALGTGALVGALLGNVTGRFAANLLDFGFRNEQVEALSQQLQAGHPALVLEVDDMDESLKVLRSHLGAFQAELIEPLHKASRKPPPAELGNA